MKTIKIYLSPTRPQTLKKCLNKAGEHLVLDRYVTVPSKKNQQQAITSKSTGESFIKQSDQYIKWKKIVYPILSKEYERIANMGVSLPLVRVRVKVIFYFPDKISRDITNKAESIMDALVDSKILYDDELAVVNNIPIEGYICKNQPRTEIYLSIIEPDSPEYEIDKTDYTKFEKQKKEVKRMIYNWKKS